MARRTTALVRRATGAARTQIARVASAPRRARRAAGAVVQYVRSTPRRRIARDVALGAARGGGVVLMAQARILPAALGGYVVSKLERGQRIKAAEAVSSEGKAAGALIKDPTHRILAGLAVTALVASRTSGMLREAACGAAGALGALYEMYGAESGNPDDGYAKEIKAGGRGI